MKVHEQGADFKSALLADPDLRKMMSAEEISASFSLDYYLRYVDVVFERVFGRKPGEGSPAT